MNSYIFRYYLKIYIDAVKDDNHPYFVKMSEKIIGLENLNNLQLFARKELWLPAEKEFDIWVSDYDSRWESRQCVIKNSLPFKSIESFSSGIEKNVWHEIDITDFIKGLTIDKKEFADLVLSIKPGINRFFEFKSDLSDLSCPKLCIHDSMNEYCIEPMKIGSFNENYSNIREDIGSSLRIMYENQDISNQSNGFLRFNISDISSLNSAVLKLYLTDLNFGEEITEIKYSGEESLMILRELQLYLEERNIDFYSYNSYNYSGLEEMIKLYADSQINYLSLNIDRKEDFYFSKLDGHSTQKAHKVIADALYEKLIKNNIIPEQYLNNKLK